MQGFSARPEDRRDEDAQAGFRATRWSMVLRAGTGCTEALEDLSRSYWPAVYAFLRRKGFSPEDAQEITQNTLIRLQKGEHLAAVDQAKGKFRSFLCACAEHEGAHYREHRDAQKRGASVTVSLDALHGEEQYRLLPLPDAPPAQLFDRSWSKILVARALTQLEGEYRRLRKTPLYQALVPLLAGGTERGDLAALAQQLGMTDVNARVSWTRFKASFIAALRREVADTVSEPSEVEPELRHLMRAWLSAPTKVDLE